MRIFPLPLNIGETEGFSTEKDIFGRHTLATGLTNLVDSVADPMVIAVDGQWGSGKTTFLKMWRGDLRQQGFPVIYFDAFENDYADDAFTVLAGEIVALVDAAKKSDEPKAKAFLSRAVGASKVIARSALKVGVKVATAGALEASVLDDFAEAVSSEAEELTDKHIGELLTKQAERKGTLQAFRDALRDLPSILAKPAEAEDGVEAKKSKPLIFMIDELDRCKPIFALELLERIKHFFAVPNVHFVLGAHMGQLRNSVNAAYGEKINSNTYLQKFISLTFPLTDSALYLHDRSISKYINHLRQSMDIATDDRDFADGCINFAKNYALIHDCSLRDVEHLLTNIALAAAFTTKNTLRPSPIIAGLSILRVAHPGLYVRAKLNKISYQEVERALSLNIESEGNETAGYSQWERAWWEFCLKEDIPDELKNSFNSGLWNYNVRDRFRIISIVSHRVVDNLIPAKQ